MGSSASKTKPKEDNAPSHNDGNNNKKENKGKKISNEGSGPYQPYAEFPVIQHMREAQVDYKESTYTIENDDNDVPLPFPPVVSKRHIYEKYNFAKIDAHAENAPSELLHDAGQLVAYLCQVARDDVEKVRAIFAWISSRDRSNTLPEIQTGTPPSGSPLEQLNMIMTNASTYAYNPLFAMLCKEANIPCRQILGKIRASARELGDSPTSSGTYYMVFAEGNWHFVHPHWGSCYVKRVTTREEWRLVEGISGQKSGLSSVGKPNLLAFAREDFWFFVDPEVMAHFFLSIKAEDQLLARPISQPEYQVMARLYQPFFQRQFTSISPGRCKLDETHETVTFEIGLPENTKVEFDYGICKRAIDPEWKAANDFRRFVFMERVGNNLKTKFDMPHIGVYKFELNAHAFLNPDSSLTLCEYFIDNKSPNFACRLNPKNTLNEWGAGQKAQQVGLEPEHEGGLIEAHDGQAVVKFRLTEQKNLKFSYKIEDEKGKTDELKDFVRYSNQEDKSSVIIRTPHYGKYVLKVQAKAGKDKEYQDVCNYLVTSDRGVADDTPFPKARNGQIGPLEKKNKLIMEAVSHNDPIIEDESQGRIEIRMKEHGDLEVIPKLTIDNQDKSEYVYHYKDSVSERIYVLVLPSAGWYSLNILARERGSNTDHEPAFQYIVIIKQPRPRCVPFPQTQSGWKDNFIIIDPQDGQLSQNMQQRFRFKIPGAASVTLIRGEHETKLNKANLKELKDENKFSKTNDGKDVNKGVKTDGNLPTNIHVDSDEVWEAEMDTGNGGSEIKVVAKQKGADSEETLLLYKVMSDAEKQAAGNAQRNAELDAERKLEKENQRKRQETEKAQRRTKAAEKRVKEQKEDYLKNKDKYLAKQRKLEEEAVKKEDKFDMKEFQGRTEKKKGASGWKELQAKITKEMRLEKLREAIRAKDRDRLETAIDEAKSGGVPQDEELLIKADKELEVIIHRDELRESIQKREPAAIKAYIEKIYDNNFYYSRLQQDVAEAIQVLERLQRMIDLRVDHLEMNSGLFSELRRYNKPPELVHRVIQATLLLFEEDEDTTGSWRTCQQHLNPSGVHSMNRKILDFNPSNVHEEVAARTRQILEEFDIKKVQEVSPAAATFYAWSMGATESLVSEDSKVKPASIRRQCELFGRPMESPTRGYDFRFSMRKSKTKSPQNSPDPKDE